MTEETSPHPSQTAPSLQSELGLEEGDRNRRKPLWVGRPLRIRVPSSVSSYLMSSRYNKIGIYKSSTRRHQVSSDKFGFRLFGVFFLQVLSVSLQLLNSELSSVVYCMIHRVMTQQCRWHCWVTETKLLEKLSCVNDTAWVDFSNLRKLTFCRHN
jgi:hypothetical protein